jgi:hypothetical protein
MRLRTVWGVAASAAALAGCSAADIQNQMTDSGCRPGPIVFVIPDVSGSTTPRTGVRGPYERDMMKAITGAARACGDVYSAPADGNSVGKAWIIDGKQFRQTVGANENLGAEARAKAAEQLRPAVRKELRSRTTAGTDLTGSLLRIRKALDGLPRDRRIKIVLITDGAIVIEGRRPISMYDTPLDTQRRRELFVRRLATAGELPDFGGRVDIYLSGVGVGISDRERAKNILATWDLLIPAMNAHLQSNDPRLRYP